MRNCYCEDADNEAWCSNCRACKKKKEFYADKTRHNGVRCYCKKCDNLLREERRKNEDDRSEAIR